MGGTIGRLNERFGFRDPFNDDFLPRVGGGKPIERYGGGHRCGDHGR